MKIIAIIGIIIVWYYIIGLIQFLRMYDEAMEIIEENNSERGIWLSILYTITFNTPYNVYNDVSRFIKKILKK